VLMHMVAGAVSRRLPGSTEPFLGRKRGRSSSSAVLRRTRRRVSSPGSHAQTDAESSSVDSDDAASVTSNDEPSDASNALYSDAGTDDTLSGGEEAEDDAPVPIVSDREREYKDVFGEMPTHDAVVEVVCLAASLMGKLCGDNKEEGHSLTQSESEELADEAYAFVTKYVRVLFGPVNTTKMHTLAYHLLDELLQRGNVIEADTSVNEALHKLIKIMWTNTNKQGASFTIQMLRCEQTLSHIIESDLADKATTSEAPVGSGGLACPAGTGDAGHAGASMAFTAGRAAPDTPTGSTLDGGEEADDEAEVELDYRGQGDEADADSVAEDNEEDIEVLDVVEDAGADGAVAEPRFRDANELSVVGRHSVEKRKRFRVSGRRITVGDVAAADDGRLRQLPTLLGASAAQQLVVVNSFKIDAMLPWRAKAVPQLVRAARVLYRRPWFDHVYYHAPGDSTEPQLGLARLLVRAVSGVRRELLVVQRLELAEYRPACVLSRFNCRRYKWVMDPLTGFPALALVPLSRVMRLEHVVPDFEELGRRWGLLGTPTTTPETPHERQRERFFTNVFFPWTTNSITDAP